MCETSAIVDHELVVAARLLAVFQREVGHRGARTLRSDHEPLPGSRNRTRIVPLPDMSR